jgi:hypothetical protein
MTAAPAHPQAENRELREIVAAELLAHGEFSSSGNSYLNALLAADAVIAIIIEKCASVAYGFNAAANSPDMQPFVDACLIQAVYNRDFKIGNAIRDLSTVTRPESKAT